MNVFDRKIPMKFIFNDQTSYVKVMTESLLRKGFTPSHARTMLGAGEDPGGQIHVLYPDEMPASYPVAVVGSMDIYDGCEWHFVYPSDFQ